MTREEALLAAFKALSAQDQRAVAAMRLNVPGSDKVPSLLDRITPSMQHELNAVPQSSDEVLMNQQRQQAKQLRRMML